MAADPSAGAERSASRSTTVAARLIAPSLGMIAVVVTAIMVGGDGGWWIGTFGLAAVVLAATSARVPLLPEAVVVIVLLGAAGAAAGGRLSAPAAAGLGMLLLGYVLAADLAATVEYAGGVGRTGLVGWTRSVLVPLAIGVGGGALMAVAVVLPFGGGAWLVVLAPLALLLAVVLATGRLQSLVPRRPRPRP